MPALKYTHALLAGIMAIGVSGCALHSVDHNPAPTRTAPALYSMDAPANATLSGAWFNTFGDEKLASLINAALDKNLDIEQAVARLKQAEALADQNRAVRLPSVDIQGDSNRRWIDGDKQETYSEIGAALSWELDLFDRLGARARSGRLMQEAAAHEIDAVRMSIAADLAYNYYNAVAQHKQMSLLRQQEKIDRELLDLVSLRQREGVGTRVDVLQQQGQLSDTQSLIPPAQGALRVYENRMDVLLGAAPDAANRTGSKDKFAKITDLPKLGVPSDLLLNRPDLRAMHAALVAADEDIGAAIADRLPRLTLTGSYMYADGPQVSGPVGTVIGGLLAPLLDWGRREAEVKRNRALYEERLAAFTQSWLGAIEEVENALYQENRQREFIRRLEERRRVLNDTLTAAQEIFKQGLSDYLPVLDAVQNLRTVERTLVMEERNLVLLRIQLFRALGAPITPTQ